MSMSVLRGPNTTATSFLHLSCGCNRARMMMLDPTAEAPKRTERRRTDTRKRKCPKKGLEGLSKPTSKKRTSGTSGNTHFRRSMSSPKTNPKKKDPKESETKSEIFILDGRGENRAIFVGPHPSWPSSFLGLGTPPSVCPPFGPPPFLALTFSGSKHPAFGPPACGFGGGRENKSCTTGLYLELNFCAMEAFGTNNDNENLCQNLLCFQPTHCPSTSSSGPKR